MRLKEDKNAVELAKFGGLERGADFSRVMAIVVDDGHVVGDALNVETAADAGEFEEAFADEVARDIEIERDSSRRGGVTDVVHPRRMSQAEDSEVVTLVGEMELASEAFKHDIADD